MSYLWNKRCHLKVLLRNCDGGGFIDDDGSGNYKDGLVSDISIYPSDIESGFNKKISIV
jgi:hypothetical protein